MMWNDGRSRDFIIVVSLFIIVFGLELATPTEYVFGYLYTGPILLANPRLGRWANLQASSVAVLLTFANLWIPGGHMITTATVINRVIAGLSLMVTGGLSDLIRRQKDAAIQQEMKLQAQAQLANLREDFASTLTHDLKTPLWGAIETIHAFQQGHFGAVAPTQNRILATLKHSHETSLQLLETLLDIYRNDAEGLQLAQEPVNLTVLAEQTLPLVLGVAASRQVHVSIGHAESDFRQSLWVLGDPVQLTRVLSNLLVNAINHSRRGEAVQILLEAQTAHQVVTVLDTGAGIQPEEFSHLFERFYQGHGDRQAKGSGLGLYLARQIVEAHGGTIWAENRLPQGARFGFRLPRLIPSENQINRVP
jgi:two-component system, NarL family, sensor kinase